MIIAASVVCATQSLNAAVQIANGVVVNSTIAGASSTSLPHAIGKGVAAGIANALNSTLPSPGSLAYTGFSSLNASSNGSGANSQNFDNNIIHEVQFGLDPNEFVNITFAGSYSLTSAFLDSSVSWTLTGPDALDLWTPTTVTSTIGGPGLSGSINESLSEVGSAGGGNYILTLLTRTSGDTTSKTVNLATASFSDLDFTVTPAPEPGVLGFACAAACLMLVRRKRI
jgi:molybdopterin-binding protein